MRRLGVAGAALIVLLAGCGRGGDDAAAQVQNKQEALDEAKADLDKQAGEFCRGAATYITALDRYGDLLTQTAPTVGDVTEAGADLAEPRDDVVAAAGKVQEAKKAVATAEQELAAAKATLASASPSPVPSVEPSVSAATVDRVRQADADLAAAQKGISVQTPIREASERFNAAAVALEMAWLQVLDESGCLTETQYEQARKAARDYTLALQKSLAEAGYYEGEIDGVYGPTTVSAVEALQKKNGLLVTGTVDKATDAALQAELAAKGGQEAQQATASTAAVQQTLKLAGHWTGPVDGAWTPELTEALKDFQTELKVEPTGTVDAATIAAVENAAEKNVTTPAPKPSS